MMTLVCVTRNLCAAWWQWCYHCIGAASLSAQLKTLYSSCILSGIGWIV